MKRLGLMAMLLMIIACQQEKSKTPTETNSIVLDSNTVLDRATVMKRRILERDAPNADEPSPEVIQVFEKLNFGNGYNSSTGEAYYGVLDYKGVAEDTELVGGARGNTGSISVDLIETKEQFKCSLNLSASLELDFELGAWKSQNNVKLNALNETEFNDFSQNLVIKAVYENEPITIIQPRIREDLIELARTDPETFMRTCGDMFVSRIYTGGELYMVFNMSERDSRENSRNDQFIKSTNQYFTTTVNVEAKREAMEETSKKVSNLKTLVITNGGMSTPEKTSIESYLEYAGAFKEQVSNDNRAVVLYVELSPYENIAGFPQIDFSKIRVQQRQVLNATSDLLSLMRTDESNAQFVLEHKSYFTQEDVDQAIIALAEFEENSMVVSKILRDCKADPDACDMKDLELFNDYEPFDPQVLFPSWTGDKYELPINYVINTRPVESDWITLIEQTDALEKGKPKDRLSINDQIEIRMDETDDPECRFPIGNQTGRALLFTTTRTTGMWWWKKTHRKSYYQEFEYPYYELRYVNPKTGQSLKRFKYTQPVEVEPNVMVQVRLVNPLSTVNVSGKHTVNLPPRFGIVQGCEGEDLFLTISSGDATPQDPNTTKTGALTSGTATKYIKRPAVEKVTVNGVDMYYYDWD